ncbi:MAG TPA: rod shape-determining protein RodA [Actinomycetota bacterium]
MEFGRVERIGREHVPGVLSQKAPIRHLDLSLVLTAGAITAFGCLMVWSASHARLEAEGLSGRFLFDRQVVFSLVGFGAMIATAAFSYRRLKAWGPLVYVAGIALLAAVLTSFGSSSAGAQRWIDIGFLQFQPSEFAKLGVLVVVALILGEQRGDPGAVHILSAVALTTLPAILIYLQPDLGTLLAFVAILTAQLVLAGTRARVLLLLVVLGVVAVIGVLHLGLLQDYQLARLTGFLDPTADPQRTGYNLNQAMIAVGSGQMMGKGLFTGSQTNLDFVPEVHTDFIFTAIGEELGFIGAVVLLALFTILLWRGLRIAMMSKDLFGTLLAGGVVAMLAFQMFINIGMTIGVSPITGIPLPFVSYGGSSMLTTWVATGILLNVHMRRL